LRGLILPKNRPIYWPYWGEGGGRGFLRKKDWVVRVSRYWEGFQQKAVGAIFRKIRGIL